MLLWVFVNQLWSIPPVPSLDYADIELTRVKHALIETSHTGKMRMVVGGCKFLQSQKVTYVKIAKQFRE